jgi:hypothetical protein
MSEKIIYLNINENTMLVINELLNNNYSILIRNDGAFSKVKTLCLELLHNEYDDAKFCTRSDDDER